MHVLIFLRTFLNHSLVSVFWDICSSSKQWLVVVVYSVFLSQIQLIKWCFSAISAAKRRFFFSPFSAIFAAKRRNFFQPLFQLFSPRSGDFSSYFQSCSALFQLFSTFFSFFSFFSHFSAIFAAKRRFFSAIFQLFQLFCSRSRFFSYFT